VLIPRHVEGVGDPFHLGVFGRRRIAENGVVGGTLSGDLIRRHPDHRRFLLHDSLGVFEEVYLLIRFVCRQQRPYSVFRCS
jgi:hypothetical protein